MSVGATPSVSERKLGRPCSADRQTEDPRMQALRWLTYIAANLRRTNEESFERKQTQTAVAHCRAGLKTYRWEKSTTDVKMMAELKKEKKSETASHRRNYG